MSINIKPEVKAIFKNIIEWRRHIHTYPELGMELPETAKFVAEKLISWGIDVETEIGISGVTGDLIRPTRFSKVVRSSHSCMSRWLDM